VSRARTCTVVAAARRELWLPGLTPPAYLNGSLPGDFGFDPLGLGKDPAALNWYVQAEIFHCRTAMAGVAGILIPGILTKAGVLDVPDWFVAGKVAQDASPIPFSTLLVSEFFLFGFVEGKRWMDILKPKSQGAEGSFVGLETVLAGTDTVGYPGGFFDPLNLSKDPAFFADYKLKEIQNGRLAMLAFLGFSAQYVATGKGPFDNLAAHLADPTHANFTQNGVSVPFL